jgi:hypothetical protein
MGHGGAMAVLGHTRSLLLVCCRSHRLDVLKAMDPDNYVTPQGSNACSCFRIFPQQNQFVGGEGRCSRL